MVNLPCFFKQRPQPVIVVGIQLYQFHAISNDGSGFVQVLSRATTGPYLRALCCSGNHRSQADARGAADDHNLLAGQVLLLLIS